MNKKYTELLKPDTFYHIYNRGVNGDVIFKKESNYNLFLQKYAFHVELVANTYAYCLLSNHFHLLIKTKTESEILVNAQLRYANKTIDSISDFIGNQFAHLFNGYTQIINKDYNRTGALFEKPFRRIEVNNDAYFSQLIWYIHHNPQKHGFVSDFRDYPHSSYHSHLHQKVTKLRRDEVLNWFGSATDYVEYHKNQLLEDSFKELIIEFD